MTSTRHVLWVLLATVGCATPMSSLRADNHRLTQSVAELRADRRAQDRKLRDLEHQLAILKDKQLAGETAPPQLPVEVVAPPDTAAAAGTGDDRGLEAGQRFVGIADDGSEIIYEGDAALGKPATYDDDPAARRTLRPSHDDVPRVASSERLEVTRRVPPVSARATRAHVRADRDPSGDAAGTEYRAAVALVRSGQHEEAVTALRSFLQHYPRHDYADNAQYWLGETYYARKDYQRALVEFRATIETYPRGNKVPDALLKVGYCYQALGQADKARAVLEQVVNLYPKTEPAALAAKRLEAP